MTKDLHNTIPSHGDATIASQDRQAEDAAPGGLRGDPYEVLGEMARGGMGRISKAKDKRLGRVVALKELLTGRGKAKQRFWREALITARLQHPSIVPLYEAGDGPTGEPFFAMKLVDGKPLDKVIAERPIFEERLALLPVIIDVCEAMAYAHTEKIIHRDLKPANVLVGSFGETVVIDWGIAKDLSEPSNDTDEEEASPHREIVAGQALTTAGAIMGTPAYMPPEQAHGKSVDPRADVYALGAMLYHLLAGKMPFSGQTAQDILMKIAEGPPPAVESIEPKIPQELASIVKKAMAYQPQERYQDATSLLRDLNDFHSGRLVGSHQYSFSEVFRRWLKRYKAPLLVALVASMLLVLFGGVAVYRIIQSEATEKRAKQAAERAEATAVQERNRAEQSLVSLLIEQGRQSLLKGEPAQAAVFLSDAYRRTEQLGNTQGPLRYLLKKAMRSLDAHQWGTPTNQPAPSALAVSPDGSLIALASPDKTLSLWSPKEKSTLASIQLQSATKSLHFSSDGATLLAVGGGAFVIETSTAKIRATLPISDVSIAALSQDSALAVTASGADVSLWDASTGALRAMLPRCQDEVSSLALSADGGVLVVSSGAMLQLFDTKSGRKLRALEHRANRITNAIFSPDGSRVAVIAEATEQQPESGVLFWRVQDGERLAEMQRGTEQIAGLSFSPDGRYLMGEAHLLGYVHLWDSETGKLFASLPHDPLQGSGASRDGSLFYTLGGGVVRIWGADAQLLLVLSLPFQHLTHAWFADGSLFTFDDQGELSLWSTTEAHQLSRTSEGMAPSKHTGLTSEDGSLQVVPGPQGAIVQETSTREERAQLSGLLGELTGAHFTQNKEKVAVLSKSDTEIWNVPMSKHINSLDSNKELLSVRFSLDGQLLAALDDSYNVSLWDPETGKLLSPLLFNASPESPLEFSKDGRALRIGVSDQGTFALKIWQEERSPAEVLKIVEQRTSLQLEDGKLCPRAPPKK